MAARRTAAPATDDGMVTIDEAADIFSGDILAVDSVYTGPDGKPLGLIARLAKIKADLPVLDPEGTNKFFNYKFVKNTQVLGVLRPRLSKQLVMIVPETVDEREPMHLKTQKGGDSLMTRITVTWRVVCGVTGESFTGQSVGYGDDSGDKGANKAFTAAQKNFLIRLFEIGGEPDIEEDESTDKRSKAREAGSERVSAVVVGDATIEGVERGGKASKATEAQVARVGQYARDLQLDAGSLASVMNKVLEININFGDEPWKDIKAALETMTGKDIGKLIAALDDMYQSTVTTDANGS